MIDLQRSMIRLILLMITLNIALSFLETPQISRKVTGRCRALSAAATEVLDVIEIAVDAASATPALVQTAVPVVVPASVAAESVRMFSDPDAVRYFFAGGTCAGVSHGITVPIDVVKTRLQTDPDKYDDDAGIIGVAQRIIAEEGVGMLGRGLGPTVAGYCVQGAIKYGFYEALKPVVNSYFISHGIGDELGAITGIYKILALVIASSSAEMLGSSALAPFEAARIRVVSQPTFATGIKDALQRLVADEGIEALFKGLPAILVKQIPYTVVSLTIFETASGALYRALPGIGIDDISSMRFPVTLTAACLGAILSCVASQPGDTLLSRVNQSARPKASVGEEKVSAVNPISIMLSAAKELGPVGLFRGIKARLLHSTTIVVSQLLIYDQIKAFLGIAAAGAH